MSADKKSSAHSKQRRKSPCNVLVIHEVAHQNGGTNLPTSPPYSSTSPKPNMNGLVMHRENSPNLSVVDIIDGTKRKLSLNNEERIEANVSINGGSTTPVRRSHTESEISMHLPKSPLFSAGDNDDVFVHPSHVYETFNNDAGSLHRPVTIEEELVSKVNQINSLVHLWRKRWKQQKDYSDLLSKQLQATERECDQMVQSVKDIYTEKIKQTRKELSKEILDRQKVEREKSKLETLYKRSAETHKSEYEKLHQIIKTKGKEAEIAQSFQDEARTTIKDLKKELSKVKRENEKLVKHICKLRAKIIEVENSSAPSISNNQMTCTGDCEHKLLFDLAIQRLKFYENSNDLSCSMSERRTNKRDSVGKYKVTSDPDDPTNVSIEKSYSQTIEGLNLDLSTSLNCIYDHSKDSAVELSPTLDNTFENNNSKLQPELNSLIKRERTPSSCSKDSILSHDTCIDHKVGSRDSMTSDSAVSTEGHPSSPHMALRKSLTSDGVSSIGAYHKTKLARRTTWTHYEISPPDSGNCSPKTSPRDGNNEADIHVSQSATKLNAISGFEGLRERRNGIIDMDREVALQLKLGGKSGKKSKDFSDMFKKFSFSSGADHSNIRDKDIPGSEKKNFMNLNRSVFSRKKSSPVGD